MICCQALLLVFTAQWLQSQYLERQEQLKKNLTKLFTDVQHRISDSLLLTQVIDPKTSYSSLTFPNRIANRSDSARTARISPQGLHRLLTGASTLSKTDENRLFQIDTIAFNELFASEMRNNGWNFTSTWINSADSGREADKSIFIQSTFFTDENGVVVRDYRGYLAGQLVAPVLFVCVLLSLTGAAFIIAFRSLKAQIKLSNLKDDFINNMSHELKTPIATVKVALEALTNFNLLEDPITSREYLGMAAAEMDRLELLATRVLNTSLLEDGRINMHREPHDMALLLADVLKTMQLRIAKHGAKLTLQKTGTNFRVAMDKLHMQGVLINLLDNCLKYGPQGVHIDIQLTAVNGKVQLSVADNGPGIPEEYREKVFEKFFRVPTGNHHNAKGYGLGLNYAAQVMRQHNGSIQVGNRLPASGCAFTLVL